MKHPLPPAEVEALAERLRSTRQRGQPIGAWLEEHARYLQALIPKTGGAGYTWNQVAEAVNMAGITYAAGQRLPLGGVSRGVWAGRQLQKVVHKMLHRADARRRAIEALPTPARQPAPPSPAELPPSPGSDSRPKLHVFGLEPLQRQPEPKASELQKHVDEKAARTRAILDQYFRGKDGNG